MSEDWNLQYEHWRENKVGFETFDPLLDQTAKYIWRTMGTRLKPWSGTVEYWDFRQELAIKVFVALKAARFCPERAQLVAWMMRVAQNLLMDMHRHLRRKAAYHHLEDLSSPTLQVGDTVDSWEEFLPSKDFLFSQQPASEQSLLYSLSIKQFLAEQPERTQNVALGFSEGYTYREIAQEHGCSASSVMRLIKKLEAEIQDDHLEIIVERP